MPPPARRPPPAARRPPGRHPRLQLLPAANKVGLQIKIQWLFSVVYYIAQWRIDELFHSWLLVAIILAIILVVEAAGGQ